MNAGLIFILAVLCVKNIEDEKMKIIMFWVLFFLFAIIFNILANM